MGILLSEFWFDAVAGSDCNRSASAKPAAGAAPLRAIARV
jgi:hypothetical protein